MIERATILAGNGPIRAEHLPTQLPARGQTQHSAAAHPPIAAPHFQIPEGSPTLRDIEMKLHPGRSSRNTTATSPPPPRSWESA